jgi:hypothetical protein
MKKKTCGGSCRNWFRNTPWPDMGWCGAEMPKDYLHRSESNVIPYESDSPSICPSFSPVGGDDEEK